MLFAPSAERNFAPITRALEQALPSQGRVLEVASGTGQHIAGLAARFPAIEWIPNDIDRQARRSVAAYKARQGLDNMAEPLGLDVSKADWFQPVT
ncbi:MAG: DUF938 domain-containing protein, partial [Rhizobiales bacterium]|nr:DUF938 domain-containing protein [Hyphomicrobiales bacterium]